MYRGINNSGRSKRATGEVPYGLRNKVHSVQVHGVGAEGDYYGPPRPGQSWAQYESFMDMPIAVGASGAVIGALIAGPVGAIVGGMGAWVLSSSKTKNKSLTQGG